MEPSPAPPDAAAADYIEFAEFRAGLPLGRFHVVVNPDLARRFVARRLHATQLAIALVGCGIAAALAGYPISGLVLVGVGVVFRRAVRRQAGRILLELASRQPQAYEEATARGVMEVQRRQG